MFPDSFRNSTRKKGIFFLNRKKAASLTRERHHAVRRRRPELNSRQETLRPQDGVSERQEYGILDPPVDNVARFGEVEDRSSQSAECLLCSRSEVPVKQETTLYLKCQHDRFLITKTCNSCKCPRESHDLYHEEWVNVRERLGFKAPSDPDKRLSKDRCFIEGYSWVPPGLPSHKIEQYFKSLPPNQVPKIGSQGEKYRDKQLATQLPKQDLAIAYCKHVETQHHQSFEDFINARNEIALDIGYVKQAAFSSECPECGKGVSQGDLGVLATKMGEDRLWHPSCFVCHQCKNILVDLTYCVHDDHIYCERHYAEQLKPRCAACDEFLRTGVLLIMGLLLSVTAVYVGVAEFLSCVERIQKSIELSNSQQYLEVDSCVRNISADPENQNHCAEKKYCQIKPKESTLENNLKDSNERHFERNENSLKEVIDAKICPEQSDGLVKQKESFTLENCVKKCTGVSEFCKCKELDESERNEWKNLNANLKHVGSANNLTRSNFTEESLNRNSYPETGGQESIRQLKGFDICKNSDNFAESEQKLEEIETSDKKSCVYIGNGDADVETAQTHSTDASPIQNSPHRNANDEHNNSIYILPNTPQLINSEQSSESTQLVSNADDRMRKFPPKNEDLSLQIDNLITSDGRHTSKQSEGTLVEVALLNRIIPNAVIFSEKIKIDEEYAKNASKDPNTRREEIEGKLCSETSFKYILKCFHGTFETPRNEVKSDKSKTNTCSECDDVPVKHFSTGLEESAHEKTVDPIQRLKNQEEDVLIAYTNKEKYLSEFNANLLDFNINLSFCPKNCDKEDFLSAKGIQSKTGADILSHGNNPNEIEGYNSNDKNTELSIEDRILKEMSSRFWSYERPAQIYLNNDKKTILRQLSFFRPLHKSLSECSLKDIMKNNLRLFLIEKNCPGSFYHLDKHQNTNEIFPSEAICVSKAEFPVFEKCNSETKYYENVRLNSKGDVIFSSHDKDKSEANFSGFFFNDIKNLENNANLKHEKGVNSSLVQSSGKEESALRFCDSSAGIIFNKNEPTDQKSCNTVNYLETGCIVPEGEQLVSYLAVGENSESKIFTLTKSKLKTESRENELENTNCFSNISQDNIESTKHLEVDHIISEEEQLVSNSAMSRNRDKPICISIKDELITESCKSERENTSSKDFKCTPRRSTGGRINSSGKYTDETLKQDLAVEIECNPVPLGSLEVVSVGNNWDETHMNKFTESLPVKKLQALNDVNTESKEKHSPITDSKLGSCQNLNKDQPDHVKNNDGLIFEPKSSAEPKLNRRKPDGASESHIPCSDPINVPEDADTLKITNDTSLIESPLETNLNPNPKEKSNVITNDPKELIDNSQVSNSKNNDQQSLIFSGEYTKAMSKDWHSGHFCCWQCDESLTGQRYVLRDEHPYCVKCYESVFANPCEECNKIIGIDSKDLSYKDKHWHEVCFLCNKCRVSLVDKQFGSKVEKIYCGNCYDAQFASRCDGCGEIFKAGTKKMEYKTRQWHEKCFSCVVCKTPIGTKSFIPREQEIFCATCYEEKFATRCVKCNKIITSGGVTYKNEPWHRECFVCTHCSTSLAGQRFTSRDDKPYCADCFGELFAKRCTACSKPITGIGGTRFISFEDRHWHNDCFICATCKTSLVGKGFITDGEDIICPECAKQKLM